MAALRKGLHLERLDSRLNSLTQLQIDDYLQRHLYGNPTYQSSAFLNKYEFQAFSQFGEDGILQEIFRRIGTTNRYFVEFGVEDGSETNSTYLLHQGWSGTWIDGGAENKAAIERQFSGLISQNKLRILQRFITAENIESLFEEAGVPGTFDLLSVDIDRNDYHVWKAITRYQPRVVVLEYNAIFRPGVEFVVKYDPAAAWDGSSNFGASLDSYTRLAEEKGYKLVGCTFSGVNAFFVRADLAGQHFEGPFTVERFYQPPRYFLFTKNGHPRKPSL